MLTKSSKLLILALIILVPLSLLLKLFHISGQWEFVCSAITLVPLAGMLGIATEDMARWRGPTVGGLLNATFGNATELIFCTIALFHNDIDLVGASLIGSIIGNILLVLGLSALIGGLRYRVLTFNQVVAQTHSTMMTLAVLCLLIPAMFVHASHHVSNIAVLNLSIGVSVVLIFVYFAGLVFSLHTHERLFRTEEEELEKPVWPQWVSGLILFIAAICIAIESDILLETLSSIEVKWHLSRIFVGIILIPLIGNAAEHSTAVWMAMKNKMDISLNIAISSSTQIAMFVIPFLVFMGRIFGHHMTIIFTPYELIALTTGTFIAILVSMDGKSHWLEGAQLLAVYLVLSFAFLFAAN